MANPKHSDETILAVLKYRQRGKSWQWIQLTLGVSKGFVDSVVSGRLKPKATAYELALHAPELKNVF